MSITHATYVVFCSFSVLLLSFASSNAYRSVEASVIAPFEYVAIPLGVIWGILIWGEWPDQIAFLGIILILAGGLYTLYRENMRSVDVITSSPMPATDTIAQPSDSIDVHCSFSSDRETKANKISRLLPVRGLVCFITFPDARLF